MEKLARRLAHKICANLHYEEEQEAVVAYGMIALVQILVTLLLIIVFGAITGVLLEALVVCLSESTLRKYSGGAHLSTEEYCTGFGIIYCIGTAIAAKRWLLQFYHPLGMAVCLVLLYAVACAVLWKYAPVASSQKPIRTEKKRLAMRKGSFWVLGICFGISFVLFLMGLSNALGRTLGIAMILGLSWQVFTLTPVGEKFVSKIDPHA